MSYDGAEASVVGQVNTASGRGVTVAISGTGLGVAGGTVQGRWGWTAGEATGWQSDTSVTCRVGGQRGGGQSSGIVVTAGARAGSTTGVSSYDIGTVSGVGGQNAAKMRTGVSLTVFGSQFSGVDVTWRAKVGQSACSSTVWMTETALVCSVGGGAGGTGQVVITAVVQSGTMSEAVSYDAGDVSRVVGYNMGSSRLQGASVTLLAASFGSRSGTISGGVGWTDCEASLWQSSSSVLCKTPSSRSGRGSESVIVTMGRMRMGSLTEAASFQVPIVSSVVGTRANGQSGGFVSVTVHGHGLGHEGSSVSAGVGRSGAEASGWSSDSSVVCKVTSGRGQSLLVRMTVGGQGGSTSGGMSYDGDGSAGAWLASGSVQNVGGGGGGQITVAQAKDIGLVASAQGRVGSTSCEASGWASATELRCLTSRGMRGSQSLVSDRMLPGFSLFRSEAVDCSLAGHGKQPVVCRQHAMNCSFHLLEAICKRELSLANLD